MRTYRSLSMQRGSTSRSGRMLAISMSKFSRYVVLVTAVVIVLVRVAEARQGTAPAETNPRHQRIPHVQSTGRHLELKSLKGAVLYIAPTVTAGKKIPLIIHFHGPAWVVETQIANRL